MRNICSCVYKACQLFTSKLFKLAKKALVATDNACYFVSFNTYLIKGCRIKWNCHYWAWDPIAVRGELKKGQTAHTPQDWMFNFRCFTESWENINSKVTCECECWGTCGLYSMGLNAIITFFTTWVIIHQVDQMVCRWSVWGWVWLVLERTQAGSQSSGINLSAIIKAVAWWFQGWWNSAVELQKTSLACSDNGRKQ